MKKALKKATLFFSVESNIFIGFTAILLLCAWAAIATQTPYPLGIPILLLLVAFVGTDIRRVYLLLFLTIPLSTEVYLGFGLGTDIPTEQCMWLLTGIGVVLFIWKWSSIPAIYLVHPISMCILAMLAWILVTTVSSVNVLQSLKYFLARFWYVVAMFFMTLYFVYSKGDLNQIFKLLFGALFFTVVTILIRHGMEGFSFEEANFVLKPFYRNHVNYACMLAVSMPYVYWFARTRSSEYKRRVIMGVMLILLFALSVTYTRAAIGATAVVPIFYFIVRKKLLVHVTVAALILVSIGAGHLLKKYNYLEFAPNYATTIQHKSFDDVLSATYNLEDLSTMERFYRWVAGYRMIKEKPITGFGPANFYESYKPYTVTAFTTYVSDNEDRSGIHNYYLMILVEQGFPGLIIFIALIFYAFIYGQRLYHQLLDPYERQLILAALGCIMIVLVISIMNDMLETDKVGTLFFFSLALIVRGTVILRRQKGISS